MMNAKHQHALEYINNSGISYPVVYHKCAIIIDKAKHFLTLVGFWLGKKIGELNVD
ncbi:hypothetical protein [Xenorhabdus lircayensis]|uniref:Uncharacterized protein n=1 Tax=Xenorhabdus lircayensis TaxID=2763499 RepID=A0ABS0U183_9GAMM|nr:hypothetical protein [Xenorhabdus lircayensis]MBI6547639.1 hypothetical protein [Xenorhabdus lircayensis]